MKKFFRFVLIAAAIAVAVIVALKIMDEVSYDPTDTVTDALYKYYGSSSEADLDPIVELLDKYTDDLERISDIQKIVGDEVGEWIEYTNNKYLCDSNNWNACKVKLEELEELKSKVENLRRVEGEYGDAIISKGRYDDHMDNINAAIQKTEKIVEDDDATSPQTAFEINKEKCSKTSDCDNCNKNGMCTCVYKGVNGKKEELECYKPNMATK